MIPALSIDASSERFTHDFKRLPAEIKQHAARALADLQRHPLPGRLRFEKLSGHKNPALYTIHITPNHSHKLSFELIGHTAILRRIGTHKEIDRSP